VRFLIKYTIFENIQQAEKIEKSIPENKMEKWIKVKKWAINNNYSEYLGWIASRNGDGKSHSAPYEYEISFLEKVLNKIKEFKIDVYNPKYRRYSLLDWSRHVDEIERTSLIQKFINRWCPASIRNEVKSNLKSFLSEIAKGMITTAFENRIQNLSSSDKLALQKGSRAKTVDEWIDLVKTVMNSDNIDIDRIKKSNINIIEENEVHLFYEPLDHKSYKVANYKFWCTMIDTMWNHYTNKGRIFIMLDKLNKSRSLICTYNTKDKELIISSYNNHEIKNIENGVDKTHFKNYQYPEDIEIFLDVLNKEINNNQSQS
jgi:hypothetical protein